MQSAAKDKGQSLSYADALSKAEAEAKKAEGGK
jgi:hypothetical protein